jgi:hypothetical protein
MAGRSNAAFPDPNDHPLGAVELTTTGTFGVRAAALAGVPLPPCVVAGRPTFLDGPAGMTWTDHITCSYTV